MLHNLGNGLQCRYERLGDIADLQEAIQLDKQAIVAVPGDHPYMPWFLDALGSRHLPLHEQTREISDLNEGIKVARQAISLTPVDHPGRARRLGNLGAKLQRRYWAALDEADLKEAITHFWAAWNCRLATPFVRLTSATFCLTLLMTYAVDDKVDTGIQLGKEVVDMLPTLNTKTLGRNDQQFVLQTFAGVSAGLCACLLEFDRVEEALEYSQVGPHDGQILGRKGLER
jgi:hypothetical protein